MAGGVLYVVATPIGNLGDLSPRAAEVLGGVDVIAAEDTRRTRGLLAHHGIRCPLVSYYDAVERVRTPRLVARLQGGESIALVTDAGTPAISDPGYHLVRAAAAAGIEVRAVPGPSSVTALLSVAGIPCERFAFEGFLPTKGGPRTRALEALAGERRAIVLLESTRRLPALLTALEGALGDREAAVGRELTKRHEEVLRGSLAELRARVADHPSLKGEVTLVVAGAKEQPAPALDEAALDDRIRTLRGQGLGVKAIATQLAKETGASRRTLYERALRVLADEPAG